MANQIYNYGAGQGWSGVTSYSSRYSAADNPYQYDPSLTGGSSRFLTSPTDTARFASLERNSYMLGGEIGRAGAVGGSKFAGVAGGYSQPSWSLDGLGGSSMVDAVGAAGIKRHAEALYRQTVFGTHNSTGQSDNLFSANSLVKRPRLETASHLPIYPQRPGEKDCAHYMLTRTCKFGDNCKFDHPLWVPEGGLPDWKEAPLATAAESLPERPGEPDCPYFIKTGKCKFGNRCKFNHPQNKLNQIADTSVLPERPSEPTCSFYSKTGQCKFGANCIYNHPKDIQLPATGLNPDSSEPMESASNVDGTAGGDLKPAKIYAPPALFHNSKGLPIRQGEQDCPFYLKTGSCKYGATCRYNHPERTSIIPQGAAALNHSIYQTPGVISAAASLLPNIDPRLAQPALGAGSVIYPQRHGEIECDYYMKTGQCKFGERCKFHHPIDRTAPAVSMAKQQTVKLTLAGLPRREGSIICPFYLKTGTCKYGANCRYDHPPPGEVMSMAAGTAAAVESNTVAEVPAKEEQ